MKSEKSYSLALSYERGRSPKKSIQIDIYSKAKNKAFSSTCSRQTEYLLVDLTRVTVAGYG